MTEYRSEIDLTSMVDRIAAQIQRQVDQAALDKAAYTLAEFGYVKVVRCMDCKFSRIHDGKSFPGKEYKGRMYCIVWSNGYEGEWTKPDGFCHKAKRKEDGDGEHGSY